MRSKDPPQNSGLHSCTGDSHKIFMKIGKVKGSDRILAIFQQSQN